MTGWRGPEAELAETGLDFPTLGITAWQWIEEHCVIPDGDQLGEPLRLTDEMLRFLVHYYRVEPTGRSLKWGGPRFTYARGGQLVRPQKHGKGPFSRGDHPLRGLRAGAAGRLGRQRRGRRVARGRRRTSRSPRCCEEQTANVYRALLPDDPFRAARR